MSALLFDVDGVLIDSTASYARVWRHWAEHHGLDGDVVVAATHGRRGEDTVREVAPHLDHESEQPLFRQLMTAELANIVAMPGAADLLAALPAQTWGCVTSGGRRWVRQRFADAGLELPQVLVTADDVEFGKPDPSCYLLGAQQLGRDPRDCLVVEDAVAGIAAGHAAGMKVVGLATTHGRHEIAAADHIFDSLAAAVPFLMEHASR
ncbi:MAG: HAD-IA family hydrolase [Mycobacteriales bacterium]